MLQSILPDVSFLSFMSENFSGAKSMYCPNCQKLPELKKEEVKNMEQNDVVLRAQVKESICVCLAKPYNGDKLIECHSDSCNDGTFFHMSCLNYKRKQNLYKPCMQTTPVGFVYVPLDVCQVLLTCMTAYTITSLKKSRHKLLIWLDKSI